MESAVVIVKEETNWGKVNISKLETEQYHQKSESQGEVSALLPSSASQSAKAAFQPLPRAGVMYDSIAGDNRGGGQQHTRSIVSSAGVTVWG
jgi:hypothetical protein